MIVGSRGSDSKPAESGASNIFPLGLLPHIQHHNAATWVEPAFEHLMFRPLLRNRNGKTKTMAQMKEQIKAPEKIQLGKITER